MIFCTPSSRHLIPFLTGPNGSYKIVSFHDGELYVRLEERVVGQQVTVVASTQAPAQHWFELFLLLDTLCQQQARTHLILTYCGYARQDHPKPGVARALRVVTQCLKQFSLDKITVVHPHSAILQQLLPHDVVVPYDLYVPIIREHAVSVIVAPDHGALAVCHELAKRSNSEVVEITKVRPALDAVFVLGLRGDVAHKNVLIFDDIISTGATVCQAADVLAQHGAAQIYILATHNLTTADSLQKLALSPIKHAWTTNSISPQARSDQLSIINIAQTVQALIAGS